MQTICLCKREFQEGLPALLARRNFPGAGSFRG
jgi:hypothetical protein